MKKRIAMVAFSVFILVACASKQVSSKLSITENERSDTHKATNMVVEKQIRVIEQRVDELNIEDRVLVIGVKDLVAAADIKAIGGMLKTISESNFKVSDVKQRVFWSYAVFLAYVYLDNEDCLIRAELKKSIFNQSDVPEHRRMFLLADYYLATRHEKEYQCKEKSRPKKEENRFLPKKENKKEKYV